MFFDKEAGTFTSLSNAGSERCAIITDMTSLFIALLKGMSSRLSSLSLLKFRTGRSLCESISVSP